MTSPRVSVLLTTWNGARFVGAAIESVLAQTFADFELLVVDDGSTDATPSLLQDLGDQRVRVLRQENGGPVPALNAALGIARAEYVGFLDHDDLWRPTKLAQHVPMLDSRPGVAVTFSWSGLVDASGREIGLHPKRWRGPIAFRELLADFVIGNTSSVVMRRTAIEAAGGLDPGFRRYYDIDLLLRVALRGDGIEAVPEELTLYRRHETQMSREGSAMQDEWSRLLAKLASLAPQEVAAVRQVADCNMQRYFAYLAYEAGAHERALAILAAAAGRSPFHFVSEPRNWRLGAAAMAGAFLPGRVHAWLESLAGVDRRPGSVQGRQVSASTGREGRTKGDQLVG